MFIVFISNSFKDTGNTLLWRNYSFWEYCFLKWSRRFGWCMKIHASARKGSLCNIWFSYLRDVYQNISNITNINSQYFLNQGSRDGLRPLFRNFALRTPPWIPVHSRTRSGRPLRTKVYRFAVRIREIFRPPCFNIRRLPPSRESCFEPERDKENIKVSSNST